MSASYVLAPAAEADLREIIRYTRRQWGDAKTRNYVAKLRSCIGGLATGHGIFKDVSALHTGLRMVRCQHHYIFCLPRGETPALVVAIFHERMDLMVRLGARLG